MWSRLLLVPLLLEVASGLFSMLSTGGNYVIHAGNKIHLQCLFTMDDFSVYENPVIWSKRQSNSTLNVNIHGSVLEPFSSTGRFHVNYYQKGLRYGLTLTITDLSRVDEGDYYCRVMSTKTQILGVIYYNIAMREPVQKISLTLGNDTSLASRNLRSLTLVENEPLNVKCIVHGGHPPPSVEVFLDSINITEEFTSNTSCSKIGQAPMGAMDCDIEKWSDDFSPSATYDNALLKCTAHVLEMPPISAAMRLDILYPPEIICPPSVAKVGDFNAQIKCQIRSKPRLTSVHWVLDSEGTRLVQGQVMKNTWISVVDKGEYTLETSLNFHEALQSVFKSYTVVAENAIGASSQITELRQDIDSNLSEVDVYHTEVDYDALSSAAPLRKSSSLLLPLSMLLCIGWKQLLYP